MIEYLIKSAFCLTILLAVYHLLLEKEKMHRFNRFYLLFSLGFGLIIPLVSLGLSTNALQISELQQLPNDIVRSYTLPASAMAGIEIDTTYPVQNYLLPAIAIYGIISALLLLRFVCNLIQIGLRISRNTHIKISQGTIVLLNENVTPHSFLSYTFLTKQEYLSGHTKEDIIKHEFTHVTQQHSVDILFVELLKVIFWFNPVFTFYKKAMQLNHEFLADEAVLKENSDVAAYQHLLLQSCGLRPVNLASNFNYSITKKRLKMMTKHTSNTRKMVMGLSLIPVAIALVLIFSDQALAQGNSAAAELKIDLVPQSNISKEEYYKGFTIRFVNEKSEDFKEEQKFESLSEADKKKLPSPVSPTQELINIWKDSKKYKVVINFGAPLKNLDNLKPTDFVSYESSKSPEDNSTYIFLLKRDFLEEMKKLGASFNWVHYGAAYLAPPPPMAPKK